MLPLFTQGELAAQKQTWLYFQNIQIVLCRERATVQIEHEDIVLKDNT